MVPLLLLAVPVALIYGVWRAYRRWGAAPIYFVAAAVSFAGASGVLAEALWGPQWSWNFAHHSPAYAKGALVQGIFWLSMGVRARACERSAPQQPTL